MSYEMLNPPNCPIKRLVDLINQKGSKICDLCLVAGIIENFLNCFIKVIFRQSLKSYCFTNSGPFQKVSIGRLVSGNWHSNLNNISENQLNLGNTIN